jgi:hypothetical protein
VATAPLRIAKCSVLPTIKPKVIDRVGLTAAQREVYLTLDDPELTAFSETKMNLL